MYFQNLISFLLTSLIILSWHPFDHEFLFIHFVQQNEPGFICLTSSLIKGFFFFLLLLPFIVLQGSNAGFLEGNIKLVRFNFTGQGLASRSSAILWKFLEISTTQTSRLSAISVFKFPLESRYGPMIWTIIIVIVIWIVQRKLLMQRKAFICCSMDVVHCERSWPPNSFPFPRKFFLSLL